MLIREARIEDFSEIQSMANIVWPATFGPLMSEEILNYMIDLMYKDSSLHEQMINNDIKYLIIEQDNENVGYSSYELDYQGKSTLMVHRLYLLPQAQGLGFGSAVLNYLTDLAKDRHQKSLSLKVLHNNTSAYQYYLKYGFKKTGEDYNHIGHNYPPFLDYVLEKEL